MEPVRDGTKLWWYSSSSAYATTSANDTRNQWFASAGRGEVRKARAARYARIAYSVKCAAFRVMTWTTISVSGVVSGNNQSMSGPIMREVFPALKLSEAA